MKSHCEGMTSRKAFKAFDTDQSGYLDVDEVAQAVAMLGLILSAADVAAITGLPADRRLLRCTAEPPTLVHRFVAQRTDGIGADG